MTANVGLSISQFRDAWRLMCAPCPRAAYGSIDGVEYLFSGLPIGFFNVALVTGLVASTAAIQAAATAARAWAADKQVPWLFLVTHEALAPGVDATAALHASGFVPALPLTGMVAERVPRASVPPGLRLDVPRDETGCDPLFEINSAAYGMDLAACRADLGRPSFWAPHVPVVGSVEGRPVTCAAVLMAGDYRYVAMVATDPTMQRQGYAAAAMLHALDVASRTHGEHPTFLHATDAGRPIYARMGYDVVATHTAYTDAAAGGDAHS